MSTGWAMLDVVTGVMEQTRAGNLGEAIEVVTDPNSGVEVSDNTAELLDIAAGVVGLGATVADIAANKAPIEEAMGQPAGGAGGDTPWGAGAAGWVPGATPSFWGGGNDDDVIDVGTPQQGGGMIPGGGGIADELEGLVSGLGVSQLANLLLRRYPQARALVTVLGGLLGMVIGDRASGTAGPPSGPIMDAGNLRGFTARVLAEDHDLYLAVQMYREGITVPVAYPAEAVKMWMAILVAQSNVYIAPIGCDPSDHCNNRSGT